MSKIRHKMLGEIPTTKLEYNQFEAEVTEPTELDIPLQYDETIKVGPMVVLRKGSEDSNFFAAVHGIDYDIEYVGGNTVKVHIYSIGFYKINY